MPEIASPQDFSAPEIRHDDLTTDPEVFLQVRPPIRDGVLLSTTGQYAIGEVTRSEVVVDE